MKNVIVAKAVVFNEEGKLLALRRSETDERRPLQWDLPGGWVEDGEDFVQATVRETAEETGVDLDSHTLCLVFTKTAIKKPKDESMNVMWLFFLAKTKADTVTVSSEHSEHKWMTIDEALLEFEYPLQLEVLNHINDNGLIGASI